MTPERQDSPDAGGRYLSLQVLRFVAAMMVVAGHLPVFMVASTWVAPPAAFQQVVRLGYAGVDIFFVLSGFVIAMTGPLAEPRPSAAVFFWRRWRRVAPVYFVLSVPAIVGAGMARSLNWPQAVSTFLFWPGSGRGFIEPYLNPGWSLCFEMVFYTSIALLMIGGGMRRNLLVGAAVIAALLTFRFLGPSEPLRFLTSPIFAEFAAGVTLCLYRRELAAFGPRAGLVAMTGGFLLLGSSVLGAGDNPFLGLTDWVHDLRRVALCAPGSVLIVGGAMASEPWCRGRLAQILGRGGDASYSIYLTHFYSMSLLADLWWALHWSGNLVVLSLAGACAAAVGGVLTHRAIERPILRDLKRLRWSADRLARLQKGSPATR